VSDLNACLFCPLKVADDSKLVIHSFTGIKLADISPDMILRFDEATYARFMITLTGEAIDHLSARQAAALNFEGKVVPLKGLEHADPIPACSLHQLCQRCIHSALRQAQVQGDRWYMLEKGVHFSGVIQGFKTYHPYTLGVAEVGGGQYATKAEAEFEWLRAFYAGRCGEVSWGDDCTVHLTRILPTHIYKDAYTGDTYI
jgi:hypothetical protein